MNGLYEVKIVYTLDGEKHEEKALYRGNPFVDPNAELLQGRDLVRGDNAVYTSSEGALVNLDLDPEGTIKTTITWGAPA